MREGLPMPPVSDHRLYSMSEEAQEGRVQEDRREAQGARRAHL